MYLCIKFTNVNTMAKGYGLTGKIRGKLGSKVYRIEAGEQIISEYADTRQDRKSNKQIMQRSKIALANQVSIQFDWVELVGLSPNRSKARRLFVGNIVNNTSAVMDGESKAVATLDFSGLKFSKGCTVNVDAMSINKVAAVGTKANSQITFPESTNVAKYILIGFPVLITPPAGVPPYTYSIFAESEDVTPGEVCRATMVLNYSTLVTGYYIYCYAVPIVTNTLEKRVKYSKIIDASTAGILSADTMVSLARADLFGETIYLGQLTY